jgi:two-component system sensor histidine kinase YesM
MREKMLYVRVYWLSISFGISILALFVTVLLCTQGTKMVILPILYLLVFCIQGGIFYAAVWMPYKETSKKMGAFAAHGAVEDLSQILYYYNPQFEAMLHRMIGLMENSTSLELSKRQAQYLALQNQINPHFLYNTLESIRSEALISGLDSVGDMCEALATFFRYTISNQKSLVTIEEEIQNITTYFYIQQYRFGKRLNLEIEYGEDEESVQKCMIPKLVLQPIVENAIIHGVEQKIGNGTVKVQMFLTEKRLVIHVMDDGVGIKREILEQINQHMVNRSVINKERGGIAVANVNNRIKMMFGEDYGLTIYSTEGIGTDVELNLPYSVESERKNMIEDEEGVQCEEKY